MHGWFDATPLEEDAGRVGILEEVGGHFGVVVGGGLILVGAGVAAVYCGLGAARHCMMGRCGGLARIMCYGERGGSDSPSSSLTNHDTEPRIQWGSRRTLFYELTNLDRYVERHRQIRP